MRWRRAHVLGAAAAVIAAGGTAAGLVLASGTTPARPKPRPLPSVSTPTPQPVANHQLLSPFTGEPIKSLRPVLAVKIDNIVFARPQTGLTRADIIYVIPVEGGLSRFMAIFSSHFPSVIGPVRSARADDLQLLHEFRRPAFAFSGAQPELLPVVERARIVNLYAGVVGGYFRNYSRIAPYNLFAYTRTLLAEAPRASKAQNIGFVFGPAPPGGRRIRTRTVSYRDASFTFRWSGRQHRWLVWMDGQRGATTEGPQLGAPTIVIQYVHVGTSNYLEQGVRPPYAPTIGSGTALVLRNGEGYWSHWSRPDSNLPTRFTFRGQRMPFARGQVWVVLVNG